VLSILSSIQYPHEAAATTAAWFIIRILNFVIVDHHIFHLVRL